MGPGVAQATQHDKHIACIQPVIKSMGSQIARIGRYGIKVLQYHTFNARMDLPLAMATHSPVPVVCPVFIVIPLIKGDQAKFVIGLGAVYAITGSVTIRFFTSGLGEFNREPALLGDAPVCV